MMVTSPGAAIDIFADYSTRAATVVLTRTSSDSSLRAGGLKLRERVGFKRAAVAVARKPAVIMHTMLKTGEHFDKTHAAAPLMKECTTI